MKVHPVISQKPKHGIGMLFYCNKRYIGMVKQNETDPTKYEIYCPFSKKWKDKYVDGTAEGQEILINEFKYFIQDVTGEKVQIVIQ